MVQDGTIVRNQKKIMWEQFKFYKKLYSSDPKVIFALRNNSGIIVRPEDKFKLDGEITYEEFAQATYQSHNNKTPGCDGIPVDLIKTFFKQLGMILFLALKESIQIGDLFPSAKKGIWSLIPKKDKDPTQITNWRPITLMNADHKILAKVIANRLKPVMQYLIQDQQTGYIENRFIGMNIRKLADLISYVESEQIPAIMITIDFRKAFDTVEKTAIIGVMHYFGFGDNFINLILLLYKGFSTKVLNNGRLSESFSLSRQIHQGCTASGYIFVLIVETLAHKLKEDTEIKKIEIDGESDLLSQYVDDITIFLKYDNISLQRVVNILREFALSTGLKVNYDKSIVYKIGGAKHLPNLKVDGPLKWSTDQISILGIDLDSSSSEQTISRTIEKMVSITKTWKQRGLSLIGKVNLLSSLFGSLLVYPMQVLGKITQRLVKRIEQLLNEFIWSGRKPKIKLKVLQSDKADGGLNLFDPLTKDTALKTVWVKRFTLMEPFTQNLALYSIKPK